MLNEAWLIIFNWVHVTDGRKAAEMASSQQSKFSSLNRWRRVMWPCVTSNYNHLWKELQVSAWWLGPKGQKPDFTGLQRRAVSARFLSVLVETNSF